MCHNKVKCPNITFLNMGNVQEYFLEKCRPQPPGQTQFPHRESRALKVNVAKEVSRFDNASLAISHHGDLTVLVSEILRARYNPTPAEEKMTDPLQVFSIIQEVGGR